MNQDNAVLQLYKNKSCQILSTIKSHHLQQFISYHHPPKLVLKVLQAVQIILAGYYQAIQVNHSCSLANDWPNCRKMVTYCGFAFLNACIQIIDKVGKQERLDHNIVFLINWQKQEEMDIDTIKAVSPVCASLWSWTQNLIEYYLKIKHQ